MSRMSLLLVALVSSVLPSTAAAVAFSTIEIGGTQAGTILEWEGGDPRGSAVSGTPTADGTVPKQIGNVACAPLVVKCSFPPSGPILSSIGELCSNQYLRKKILLTDYDAMGRAIGATEFSEALIAEVRFSGLDAASTAINSVTLVFEVEQSRQVPPAVASAPASTRAAATNFRLAVAGLDGTGVTRIEPITIKRKSSTDVIGAARDSTAPPAQLEFSNLTVTMMRTKSSTWRAWFTDFAINGNSGDANEKSGSIEFLSSDMKNVLLPLSFQRMGILRVSRVNAPAGAADLDQVELYFEKLSIGSPPTTSGTSDSSSQAGTDGAQADTSGVATGKEGTAESGSAETANWIPVQENSTQMATGMLSGGTATDGSGTTALNLNDRLTSMEPTLLNSTTTTTRAGTLLGSTSIATTTTTNPADKGTRDPAEFPRVEGLTRVYYNGYFQPTYTQEEAGYTTTEGIFEVARRVDEAAKGAGWTLAQMSESDSSNGRAVTQRWTRPQGEAWVNFLQPRDGPTQVKLSTTLQKPPAG